MTHGGDTHGFSLVELVVVIAVVSVLALSVTLAVPRANGGANAAAVTFEHDIEALRFEAMLTGTDHAVAPLANGWQAHAAASDGGWTLRYGRELDGIQVTATVALVVLRADGSLSEGSFEISDGEALAHCAARAGGLIACHPK